MPELFIQRKIVIPTIGTWKWKQEDYKTPLVFPLGEATAYIYLLPYHPGKEPREIIWNANFQLRYSPLPRNLVRGLKTSGRFSQQAAEQIYEGYIVVLERFESILRSSANIKNLSEEKPMRIDVFFREDSLLHDVVTWWINDDNPTEFLRRLRKGRTKINPLFKKEQIVTVEKWNKMQDAIHEKAFPPSEMMELLRIRAKFQWREKKVATIEAAILVETLLRHYAERALANLGISKNRLKELRNELTFNSLLNVVLPLTLSRGQSKKLERHIQAVNVLRRIRNDLVHGNIAEEEIHEPNVRKGIESALILLDFIKKKLTDGV